MNIHRHSGSATAKVRIVRDAAGAKLEVVDAGTGIRATGVETLDGRRVRPGVGISGMRERLRLLGGKLEIDSSPQGTTVKASLPLDGSNSP
jgi:signal transduction histidine kinase